MPEDRFRAVRPANKISEDGISYLDWGVYDSVLGKSGKHVYTKAFALILASSMNWAYNEGRKGK